MYFLINLQRDELTAHKTNGAAARAALSMMGVELVGGECPVKAVFSQPDYDARFKILNLSESLAVMDICLSQGLDLKAKAFINSIQAAIETYYKKN